MKLSKTLSIKRLSHRRNRSTRIMVWVMSSLITTGFVLGFMPFYKSDNTYKEKRSINDLIEKAKADSLSAVNVENTPLATTTSTTVYTVHLNATAGNFTGGHKYFIYFELGLGSDSAVGLVNYQVKYGASVQYTGTVEPCGATASTATQVSFIDVYTQPSTAVAVTVGFKAGTASTTAGALNGHFVALNLDEKMTENYDYYYNENTSAGAHTTTMTSMASITLNNADGIKDWLVFGMEDLQVDVIAAINAEARIWDGSTAYMTRSQEGENANEQFTFAMIVPFSNTARGTTYSVQVRDSASGTQNDHTKSRIFAFDLNVFETHNNTYATGSTALGSSMTQVSTLSYTASTAGNQVVLSSYTNDVAASDVQTNDQLQLVSTTVPTGWSWAQLGTGKTSYDATDVVQSNIIAVVYMTATTNNFDLDAQEIVGTSQVAIGRSITVFSTLYNYMPQMNNWQWYADEEDTTPGTAYAAENTAPPQIEMGKSIGMKLRVNFTEVGNHLENNNRKKLYYATGTTGPWTIVGETVDTGSAWRYYNGGGTDNVTIPSALLTGSSATKGIHNESNSDSPSYSDHPAGTTVEFEYCIENYSATANTTYYFGFFDQTVGLIVPASGKTFPSLTTASAYTLTVDSAPSGVDFGDWVLGSSAYHEYNFASDEKIQFRDNRGVTAGDSSGWSLTADMTTELYFQSVAGYCGSVAFTGSGLNDMTVNSCNNTVSSNTVYKVAISDTPGRGVPDQSMWYRNGDLVGFIECSTSPTLLEEEVYVIFGAIDGHTIGDYWEFTAYPPTNETIVKSNMYWITNTLTGLYDASTTGINTSSGDYMTSAVTAATVSGSGKAGLGGFTIQPIMRIYNGGLVGNYTGVITFTLT